MKQEKQCIIHGKRKCCFLLILCISMLGVVSCGISGSRVDRLEQQSLSVEEHADEVMNQVLDALNTHDAEQLNNIFSEGTKNNVLNLSNMSEKAVKFYQGTGEIIKSDYMGTYISNSRGDKIIYGTLTFAIETEEEGYYGLIVIQNRNDYDENMKGLYLLQIVTEDVYNEEDFKWKNKDYEPGIYIQNDRADEYVEPADMLEKEKK